MVGILHGVELVSGVSARQSHCLAEVPQPSDGFLAGDFREGVKSRGGFQATAEELLHLTEVVGDLNPVPRLADRQVSDTTERNDDRRRKIEAGGKEPVRAPGGHWICFADLAEGVGFEPTERFTVRSISSRVPSTGLSHPSFYSSINTET